MWQDRLRPCAVFTETSEGFAPYYLAGIRHDLSQTTKQEDHPMWPQEFIWFFAIFHQEFRKGNRIAFEVLMPRAFAHFFGFYNPKQLADFLGIPHQKFSAESATTRRAGGLRIPP